MIDWVRSNKNLVIGVVIGMTVLIVGIVLFMQSNLFDRDAQVAEDIERYISEDGDITITSGLPEDDIIEVPEVIEDLMSFTKWELLEYEESDIDFSDGTEALRKVTAAYWNWHGFHEEDFESASNEVVQKMMNGRIDIFNYIVENDVVKQVEEDHLMVEAAFDGRELDSWFGSHAQLRMVNFGDRHIMGIELHPNGGYFGEELLYQTRSHTDIGEMTVESVFVEAKLDYSYATVHVNMTTNDGSYVSFKDLLDAGIEMKLNNHVLVDPSSFYQYPGVWYEIVTSESYMEAREELKYTAMFSSNYPQVLSINTESGALPSIIGFDDNLLSQFKKDLASYNVEERYWTEILKINRTVDDTIHNFSIWEDDLEGRTEDSFAQMIYEYNAQLPEALTLTISYNGETVDINVPNNNNQ